MKDKKRWITQDDIKIPMSDRKVVEKMIVDIGRGILEKLLLEKYNKLIEESVSNEIDKQLESITLYPAKYKYKK